MIWNQKRKYALLWGELVLLFLVIMVGGAYLTDQLNSYLKGTGVDTAELFYIRVNRSDGAEGDFSSDFFRLREQLQQLPGVEKVCVSSCAAPYCGCWSSTSISADSVYVSTAIRVVDDNFYSVYHPKLIAGRWFNREDLTESVKPVVIDRQIANKLFGSVAVAVGGDLNNQATQITVLPDEIPGRQPVEIRYNEKQWRVVGVIDYMKRSEYEQEKACFFVPVHLDDQMSSIEYSIRINPDGQHNPALYSSTVFAVLNPLNYTVYNASTMSAMREQYNQASGSMVAAVIFITLFLILNLMLGLIGILGYNIRRRRAELGLRRAVGASGQAIRRQVMMETFSLTVMALLPALILFVHLILFDVIQLRGFVLIQSLVGALSLILAMVWLSVSYPARYASTITPAVALQEE